MVRYRTWFALLFIAISISLVRYNPDRAGLSFLFVGPGETLRVWAAGYLYKGQMCTGGPYSFVRNPMYVGSVLVVTGLCMIAGSLWIWLLAVVYFTIFCLPAMEYEEKTLREKFPVTFQYYSAQVPLLYPTLRSYQYFGPGFSRKQLLRNKEHLVILAITLVYAFLGIRYSDRDLLTILRQELAF